MIQAIANNIAKYIVDNDDTNTADYEILAYGYGLIVNGIFTYAAIITSALILGLIVEMFVALGAFIALRLLVGGVHANSRVLCFATNAGVMYFSIALSFFLNLSEIVITVLYIANLLLLILYAPSDTTDQPIVKRRMLRKILGIACLSLFFALPMFLNNFQVKINILILISTITCVMLHPLIYKIYGCKKSIY
ncbi:MAG: accessory gene regulator B family protein [Defluviitaleaceae bacterium]|nr:accessory gene regulator B family protein [Defluviitaleaceae bacterium]